MRKLLFIPFLWSLLVNLHLIIHYHTSLWGIKVNYSGYAYPSYLIIGLIFFKMWILQKWTLQKGIQFILICSLIVDSIWPLFSSRVLEEVINLTLHSDYKLYSDYKVEHYQLLKKAQVRSDNLYIINQISFLTIVILLFFKRRQIKRQNQDILDAP